FCPLVGVTSISSRLTVQTARIGIPLAANRVYLACTCEMNAAKLSTLPQWNLTRKGIGVSPFLNSLHGTQQRNRLSTDSTTLTPGSMVESKNSSRDILHGSAPEYSGGPAFLSFVVFRSHLADLVIDTSLGLNWKAILPLAEPSSGFPPLTCLGSNISRKARCGEAHTSGTSLPGFSGGSALSAITLSVIWNRPSE